MDLFANAGPPASQPLSFAQRRDWLRLIRTPTIGPVAFQSLMTRFAYDAGEALLALPELSRGKAKKIPPLEHIEAELEACESLGVHVLAACEPGYPAYLRAVDPPPPVIFVWGNPAVLSGNCAAIVGSRNASANGQHFARQVARELGEAGVTIVSGLARGIDTSAHQGALETGTAAVLGGGVDHVYPRQNAELFEQIKTRGALVSESPLGYRAAARDFPRRNRIISGLCKGVIVIEAAERSGTLITARYGLEQNREVMAAPGSPLDPRTKGCNRLIRQGASLVESAEDILAILSQSRAPDVREPKAAQPLAAFDWEAARGDIEDTRTQIKGLLSPTLTAKDTLIRASGLSAPLVMAALLDMELSGEIITEPDGRICLNVQR